MKIHVTRNKWEASYGLAIIAHPYPLGWAWDILLGNRNYTVSIKNGKNNVHLS